MMPKQKQTQTQTQKQKRQYTQKQKKQLVLLLQLILLIIEKNCCCCLAFVVKRSINPTTCSASSKNVVSFKLQTKSRIQQSITIPTIATTQLYSSTGSSNTDNTNNSNSQGSSSSSSSISLVSSTINQQQLFNAFTSLDTSDQYDAVLTGLCAKIIDTTTTTTSTSSTSSSTNTDNENENDTTSNNIDISSSSLLQDSYNLLQEMTVRNIIASQRSTMALIDASTIVATTSSTCTAGTSKDTSSMKDTSSSTSSKTNTNTNILPITIIQTTMNYCIKNNCIQQYGQLIPFVRQYPINEQSKILCPDNKYRTKLERLLVVEDNNKNNDSSLSSKIINFKNSRPLDDERSKEINTALVSVSVGIGCFVTNIFPNESFIHNYINPEANLLLFLGSLLVVIDNFYDVVRFTISSSSSLVVNIIKDKTTSNKENKDKDNNDKKTNDKKTTNTDNNTLFDTIQLPTKDVLPGQLGQGIYTGTIIKGLVRLITIDTTREAQCESAALFIAYTLGLPSFPYRPTFYEAYQLTINNNNNLNEGTKSTSTGTSTSELYTKDGILRVLVWLMAPIAMEAMLYPQLIVCNPREPDSYLSKLEEYYFSTNNSNNRNTSNNNGDDEYDNVLFWIHKNVSSSNTNANTNNFINNIEKEYLLQWAYLEADDYIRCHRSTIDIISQRLLSGSATISDCIAAIEEW